MNHKVFLIKVMNMGGAERIMSALASHYAEIGEDVTVILTHQPIKEANLSRLDARVNVLSLEDEIAVLPSHKISAKAKMLSARLDGKLGKIFGLRNSDEVSIKKYHARNYDKIAWLKRYFASHPHTTAVAFLYESIFMTLLAAAKDTRVIISERGDPAQSTSSKTDMAFFRSRFRNADCIVFQSPDVRDWYVKNIGIDGKVIFNPVKADLPEPFVGERKKRIVNFCRICRQKNPFLLLKAYEMLAADHPDRDLWIYGDIEESEREYAQSFLDAAAASPYSGSVHILPARSDIHEAILDCEMFVSSSDFEGMSNSMLEAMAIGLPTVCTDCPAGGARAIIRDHENGLLVPVGDAEKLCAAMKEIIENSALAEKLSANGAKLRDELSFEKIMAQWGEIING